MERRIFKFDELDKQKQKNVMEAYARPDLGEIEFVIDDTAFRGCRDGLILTENFVATKEMFQEPNYYPIECIERIECINRKLILNGKIIYKFALVERDELDAFFAFFNEDSEGDDDDTEQSKTDKSAPAFVEQAEAEAIAVSVEHEIHAPHQNKDSKATEKLLGYIGIIFEENKSKITTLIKEEAGKLSIAALRDDSNVKNIAVAIYELLPRPFRVALREDVFVQFILNNREKILKKLIENPAPISVSETDILAKNNEETVLFFLRQVAQDLKQDIAETPEYGLFGFNFAVNNISSIIQHLPRIINPSSSIERTEVEILTGMLLVFMYGDSFHSIPQPFRDSENLREGCPDYLVGFSSIFIKYQEISGNPLGDEEWDEAMLGMLAMLIRSNKERVKEIQRKFIDDFSDSINPGEIFSLFSESHLHAEKWNTAAKVAIVLGQRNMPFDEICKKVNFNMLI